MKLEHEELLEKIDELYSLFDEIKTTIRDMDKNQYEQWQAGGFLVDTDIMSMYPNLSEVAENLDDDDDDESD